MEDDPLYCEQCGAQVGKDQSWRDSLQESFKEKLEELYENEQFWDVKIFVEGKEYKCHRLILSAHSEYFRTMFTSEFQESRQKCVHLESPVTTRCFDKILRYMYKGENILEEDTAMCILKLADYLQIQHLVKKCASMLESSVNLKNCFRCLKVAKECNLDVLRDAVLYFMVKNFKPLIENYRDKFFQLDKEDFIEVISDENLNTVSERSVCNLAVHWLQYNFETRKECFEDVMKVLKLPLVNSEYLINFLQYFPQLQHLPYVQYYINEGLTHQLIPTKRSSTDTFRSLHRVNHDMIDVLMMMGGEGLDNESISKSWYCTPVDAFLRDDSEYFTWRVLPSLQNFLKTPGTLMTVYGNSDLYIIGSTNDGATRGHTYTYNGNNGRFLKMSGPPTTHRVEHSLSECIGDYIYVLGGIDYLENPVETVSRYHTKQDSWENVGCLIEPVSKYEALSGIIGTRIYIFEKRLFHGIEVSYFQVYDTKTESCYKHRLFDFDPEYVLGFPEATVSHGESVYLFTGWDKTVRSVCMVKFTDANGMKFERIGDEFRADTLLTNCEMLHLDESLYIFGGKEDHFWSECGDDLDDGTVSKIPKDEIIRFCLKDKKFYKVDIKLPDSCSSFMIKKFTARKDVLKKGAMSRGQTR